MSPEPTPETQYEEVVRFIQDEMDRAYPPFCKPCARNDHDTPPHPGCKCCGCDHKDFDASNPPPRIRFV